MMLLQMTLGQYQDVMVAHFKKGISNKALLTDSHSWRTIKNILGQKMTRMNYQTKYLKENDA
jgi:hypothetical protein